MAKKFMPVKTIVKIYKLTHAGKSAKVIGVKLKLPTAKVMETFKTIENYMLRYNDIKKHWFNYDEARKLLMGTAHFETVEPAPSNEEIRVDIAELMDTAPQDKQPESTPADPFTVLEKAEASFKTALTDFITEMVALKVEAVKRDNIEICKENELLEAENERLKTQINTLRQQLTALEEVKEQAKNTNWVHNLRQKFTGQN